MKALHKKACIDFLNKRNVQQTYMMLQRTGCSSPSFLAKDPSVPPPSQGPYIALHCIAFLKKGGRGSQRGSHILFAYQFHSIRVRSDPRDPSVPPPVRGSHHNFGGGSRVPSDPPPSRGSCCGHVHHSSAPKWGLAPIEKPFQSFKEQP